MLARQQLRVLARRAAGRNLCRSDYRSLQTSAVRYAASNFAMPALSPTMTEGGVSAWKVKEGQEFQAGDIILEIETDKAQMDVEAQDDGVLVKIYKQDGEKDIPVGTSIAVIAEPGDDLATLTLPPPVGGPAEAAVAASSPAPLPTPAPAPAAAAVAPAPATPASSPSPSPPSAHAALPTGSVVLLPSVLGLLAANHISPADALTKITPTGPSGRILKGDVLAYLGLVPDVHVKALADSIKKRETLDLSNIKIKAKPAPEAKKEDTASAAPAVPKKPKIIVNFDELLTFNPPRPITKTVIRPPQEIDTVIVAGAQPPTPTAPAVVAADAAAQKPKLSRYDEIFYELVSAPKTRSL
ncbi:uncharacterized protein V1518DRAFT_420940 [Limtongia smithiae]|uniref:uncharacterized protein n=1 Tax=Limtongia smithiae TaxID=1125753 RepID=UPI0034CFC473